MKIEIRANGIKIEGYVNAVERKSRAINYLDKKYKEIVSQGTFKKALEDAKNENREIELRFNHHEKLGSTANELKLVEDNIGLYATATITNPKIINLAKKNKIKGWSFGFIDNDIKIENEIRTLTNIKLLEVSILDCTPAYFATSVEVRGKETIEKRSFGEGEVKMKNEIDLEKEMLKMELDLLKIENRFGVINEN